MPCKYWDAGWCYALDDEETTSEAGQCNRMDQCPQAIPTSEFIFTPAVRGITRQDSGDDSEEYW